MARDCPFRHLEQRYIARHVPQQAAKPEIRAMQRRRPPQPKATSTKDTRDLIQVNGNPLSCDSFGTMHGYADTKGTAMTSVSNAQSPLGLGSGIEALRAKRGWIITLGVIYVIAGLVALGSVVMATVVSIFIVGIMMLIAGVAEVINAFQVKSWGRFLFWLLLGALYIVAGFVTFENPLLAAALLTLILGIALVASGIMRIILAFSMKEGTP